MSEPAFFRFDDIGWVDERAHDNPAPEELIEEAERLGARRKRIAQGECGYYSEYITMPPGFVIHPHSHSFDELFIVLSGSAVISTNNVTTELRARDSAALAAGKQYGFTVGPNGIEFLVVRPGASRTTYS